MLDLSLPVAGIESVADKDVLVSMHSIRCSIDDSQVAPAMVSEVLLPPWRGRRSRENDFKINRIGVLAENLGFLNLFRHVTSHLGVRGNSHFQRFSFGIASSRN
jgi:hypothetical protein